MRLDGAPRDEQLTADLFVAVATNQEIEDLALTTRQLVKRLIVATCDLLEIEAPSHATVLATLPDRSVYVATFGGAIGMLTRGDILAAHGRRLKGTHEAGRHIRFGKTSREAG